MRSSILSCQWNTRLLWCSRMAMLRPFRDICLKWTKCKDSTMPRDKLRNIERQSDKKARLGSVPLFVYGANEFALWCIGVLLILLCIGIFVRSLKSLILFLGTLLLYGIVDYRLAGEASAALFALVLGAMGGAVIVAARRVGAKFLLAPQLAKHTEALGAPVVYLRSFEADKLFSRRPLALGRLFSVRTEEQHLVEVLREIGPVTAIGKPGEVLPRLGAKRIYTENSTWQDQVLEWFARATLVVIHVPPNPTEGIAWEIDRGLNVVAPQRLVLLMPRNRASLEWINQRLQHSGFGTIPIAKLPRPPYGSRICGIAYLTPDKRSEFSALIKPPLLRRTLFAPLIPALRLALKPVITRAKGSWTPLSLGFGAVTISGFWLAICAVAVTLAVQFGQTETAVDREAIQVAHRIMKHPNFPSELRRNSDANRALEWMSSHLESGISYVDDKDVVQQAAIALKLLELAPPEDCAAIAAGTITQDNLKKVLNELGALDQGVLHAWFRFRERAF